MDPEANTKSEQYELLLPAQDRDSISSESASTTMVTKQEDRYSNEHRRWDTSSLQVGLISAVLFVVATWLIVLVRDPSQAGFFAFHPPFQSLAVLFIVYGILTLQPTATPQTKVAGLFRHQLVILYAGFPVIFLGTWAVWYNKLLKDSDHFTTWHGKLGLLCIVWIVVQMAVGAASVWYGGAAFGGGMKAKSVWKYHRASGYALTTLLLLTAHLGGAWSSWSTKNSAFLTLLVYTLAPLAILLSMFIRVRPSKMKFI